MTQGPSDGFQYGGHSCKVNCNNVGPVIDWSRILMARSIGPCVFNEINEIVGFYEDFGEAVVASEF